MYFYPKNEEKWQGQLIDSLAKKYNLPKRVVRQIVYYPLLFTRRTILSNSCERPIRIRHLGTFVLRNHIGKPEAMRERAKIITDNIEEVYDKIQKKSSPTGFYESPEELLSYVEQLISYRRNRRLNYYIKDAKKYFETKQQENT